jgi:hypothetical protein
VIRNYQRFGSLILAVEEKLTGKGYQKLLLEALREIENDESISGMGSHLIGIGRKKEKDKEL